jgi:hypothetical protein
MGPQIVVGPRHDPVADASRAGREGRGRVDSGFVEGDIRMPERLGARLHFVTSVNDVPYVRVDINVTLATRRQIALLAHELQHALEIADRPDVTDVEAMESLFEDIGFQTSDNGRHRSFETGTAIDVQEAVEGELGGRAPHGHAPAAY